MCSGSLPGTQNNGQPLPRMRRGRELLYHGGSASEGIAPLHEGPSTPHLPLFPWGLKNGSGPWLILKEAQGKASLYSKRSGKE